MSITISGQNNNDKILASDGVLDQISGFNVVGVMTATTFDVTTKHTANHINVGSSIQLGNAGIITATTLLGNLTGNVNHESNLLLQISGSEKFRVGNGGQFGIAGANYGTAGQVFTSGGSGSAPTWSTINSDKITEGNTEAEVVDTGSDGHFKVTTEGSESLRITSDGKLGINYGSPVSIIHAIGNNTVGTSVTMILQSHDTANATSGINLLARRNDNVNETCKIQAASGGQNSVDLQFHTNGGERLRIHSGGQVQIAGDSIASISHFADDLVIGESGGSTYTGITLCGTDGSGIRFHDTADMGEIEFDHSDNSLAIKANQILKFRTNNGERLRIGSAGQLGVGSTAYYGQAGDCLVSQGTSVGVAYTAIPNIFDTSNQSISNYGKMKIKFKTVAVSGTGNVHLGLCRGGVPGNCVAGEIGIPIGFIPGCEYNASFTVGDISVTPWPANSNRYEYYVNISAFSVAGSLGIFYLGQD